VVLAVLVSACLITSAWGVLRLLGGKGKGEWLDWTGGEGDEVVVVALHLVSLSIFLRVHKLELYL
jgi:hypothetical protein